MVNIAAPASVTAKRAIVKIQVMGSQSERHTPSYYEFSNAEEARVGLARRGYTKSQGNEMHYTKTPICGVVMYAEIIVYELSPYDLMP